MQHVTPKCGLNESELSLILPKVHLLYCEPNLKNFAVKRANFGVIS